MTLSLSWFGPSASFNLEFQMSLTTEKAAYAPSIRGKPALADGTSPAVVIFSLHSKVLASATVGRWKHGGTRKDLWVSLHRDRQRVLWRKAVHSRWLGFNLHATSPGAVSAVRFRSKLMTNARAIRCIVEQ